MSYYAAVVLADKPSRYYRLGEKSGTTAYDQTGNANGTISGGVTPGQAGLITADPDTAMLFDGSSGAISVPTAGLPTGVHAWSLGVWVSVAALQADFEQIFLMSGGGAFVGLYCDTSGHIQVIADAFSASSPLVLTLSIAYHVVMSYDATTLRLYINGTQVATATGAENITPTTATIAGSGTQHFNGAIDELAFYPTALSLTQVKTHYLAGLATLDFPTVQITTTCRDGIVATACRDGLGLTTRTRG